MDENIPKRAAVWNTAPLAHVQRIIAVASGKGGVGKSTVTVNLAHALAAMGVRVGVLDADLYGPSLPHLLRLSGKPEFIDGMMQPLISGGIKAMSLGFLTGDEAAILRGPMISKALTQMLRLTRWGTEAEPLELLLVDMPPGTGDIALSLAQAAPLNGALIVTTPQTLALLDARKAVQMFQKVKVPVLGVVENMSGGVFGAGGGEKLAAEAGVKLLAQIPLEADIAQAGEKSEAYFSEMYTELAKGILCHPGAGRDL